MGEEYKIKDKKDLEGFKAIQDNSLVIETKRNGKKYQHLLLLKKGFIGAEKMNIQGFEGSNSLEYKIYNSITKCNEEILEQNQKLKTLYVPTGIIYPIKK